jgi:hypothetical protein
LLVVSLQLHDINRIAGMADDEHKAAVVAENGNGLAKALENDNTSKNGLSGEREEPQEAIERKEKNAPVGEKPSNPTHKDAHEKKSTEKTENSKSPAPLAPSHRD